MKVNKQLAEELHKPMTKKSKKELCEIKDNFSAADIAETESLSSN